MRALAFAIFAFALAACSHAEPTPDAKSDGSAVLAKAPQVGPLPAFQAPVPTAQTLPNGLTLIVLERPGAPLETIIFTTRHGAVHDGDKAGLASLSGEMLQAGSAGRSASQIASEVTALGSELHLGASREDLTGALTVLADKLPQATALLGDVMLRPNLDPHEFTRVKDERKARLVALLDEPRSVAGDVFVHTIFGDTGYGRPLVGTARSIESIGLDDVRHYLDGIGARNSAIIAAGPVGSADVRALVEKAFGAQKPGAAEPMINAVGVAARAPIVLVDKPGAPQSVLRLGAPSVPANSPDRYAIELANIIFGGTFTSRINQNLREQHGYTYGAHSDFEMYRGGGFFLAETDVKTEVTGVSIKELRGELTRMAAAGLTDADLDKARALFAESLVEVLQTTPSTARAVAELWVSDLPLDEYAKMLPAIAKLTTADVNAAWKRAVDAGKLSLVIVGDAKAVKTQLQAEQLGAPVLTHPPK
ncbi:MAG: insulinase family protein [Deltaproteobacteria bacterium]|nr:insulinase family protein [Deltaproteobacteria bacterium]